MTRPPTQSGLMRNSTTWVELLLDGMSFRQVDGFTQLGDNVRRLHAPLPLNCVLSNH